MEGMTMTTMMTSSADPPWWMNGTLGEEDLKNGTSSLVEMAEGFPAYMTLLMTLSCGLILVVGLVGNCLVPVVIWNNRDLRNSTNLFLLNLSLADILVLGVSMPTVLVEIHQRPEVWILGRAMCKSSSGPYLVLRC